MSENIDPVPSAWEKANADRLEREREREEARLQRYRIRGIKSHSAPRISEQWGDCEDEISHIEQIEEGLRFRVSDPTTLGRGRDHEVVVNHRLIKRVFLKRNADPIAAKDARIAELEDLLKELYARISDLDELVSGMARRILSGMRDMAVEQPDEE